MAGFSGLRRVIVGRRFSAGRWGGQDRVFVQLQFVVEGSSCTASSCYKAKLQGLLIARTEWVEPVTTRVEPEAVRLSSELARDTPAIDTPRVNEGEC